MINFNTLIFLSMTSLLIQCNDAITSPITPYLNYTYATELRHDVADLWWNVDETSRDITFELHVKTTGWIALGISPAGGMKGADIGLGWIDDKGQLHFQDRYAYGFEQPVMDNTTMDWFGLRGREMNGWTAIQFTRALDTCDTMDVSIRSGTEILIFAYGLDDPDMSSPEGIISYHGDRRGSRILALRSYGNPPPEEKFAGLDYFDFRSENYLVPPNDTTYHCKIYRVPANMTTRRHAIAHKTMIDPENIDLVHHLLMYECDPLATFDDDNLPEGVCDDVYQQMSFCFMNIATGWAVGGDAIVEFPEIAGYPVGRDFEIKYYMVQIHYDNRKLIPNRRDSSGLRFYLGNELRQHDLGYLTFGTDATLKALAIPPRADQFIVDAYCTATGTSRIPESGITVVAAFPHTHLQGRSLWTKIIRNRTAVDYLFNAEAYDFNYQFENKLWKPIKLYPGDEFATRCVYSTTNKNETTVGGEATKDEMCLQFFTYYPRMRGFYACLTENSEEAWKEMLNKTDPSVSMSTLRQWLKERNWTAEAIADWQIFYNNASRFLLSGQASNLTFDYLPHLPEYEDLKAPECKRAIQSSTTIPQSSTVRQSSLTSLMLISLCTAIARHFFHE